MSERARALGLEVAVDPAGNLLLTLPGADRAAPVLVIGSHLDSVRQGGNYDGAAGVLAGLAAVAGMRQAGFVPGRDITVLVARAEESGSWFPTSFPGSRAALGRLPPEALAVRRLDTGRTLAEHMAEEGFDPEAVRARRLPAAAGAGARLSGAAYRAGAGAGRGGAFPSASSPASPARGGCARRGCWANTTTPAPRPAASAATPRSRSPNSPTGWTRHGRRWRRPGIALVCTFCVLATTEEAGFTKIPGEARFQLDVRSVEPASVDALYAALHRLVPEIEARRGVRFELGEAVVSPAAPMDAGVQAALARAADAPAWRGGRCRAAAATTSSSFAQAGVPAGLLFVRNQHGSHNPQEAMRAGGLRRRRRGGDGLGGGGERGGRVTPPVIAVAELTTHLGAARQDGGAGVNSVYDADLVLWSEQQADNSPARLTPLR